MIWSAYIQHFEEILKGDNSISPYNEGDFFKYTKLNFSRQKRWLKRGLINENLKRCISSIDTPQNWVLITEPWCGDAAHNVPMIYLISQLNPLINLDIQLRDSPGSEIANYLTNGNKSIPILIMRDEDNKDLGIWSSRPIACQNHFNTLKASGMPIDEVKLKVQEWYNQDAGKELQLELIDLIQVNKLCKAS